MPPPTILTGRSQPTWSSSTSYVQVERIFLLILSIVACIRLVSFFSKRRERDANINNATLCQEVEEKTSVACQVAPEKDVKQLLHPQSPDHLQSTVQPIYPWTSPPQQLPGPYDPRLYPLPTLRRHSFDPSLKDSEDEDCKSISYTRRVSTNSIPNQRSIIHGTMTKSSKGWRRNQWTITGE